MSTSSSSLLAGSDIPSSSLSKHSCTACLVSFASSDLHRAHMRCDWHVYNLKRRVASLPAVSFTIFENQVVPASVLPQQEDGSFIQETCDACHKSFYTVQAYQGHLQSKIQTRNMASQDAVSQATPQDDDTGIAEVKALSLDAPDGSNAETSQETDEKEETPFLPSACIFCPIISSDMATNLTHMQRTHGLFIPAQEHLIDMESFLAYLWTLISDFHECLYCSTTKATMGAVRHHMRDKGHCRIDLEEDSEWWCFWEFAEDGEEEGEGEDEELDATQKVAVRSAIDAVDNELHLPSGKILSHRHASKTHHNQRHHHHHHHKDVSQSLTLAPSSPTSSSPSDPTNPITDLSRSVTTTTPSQPRTNSTTQNQKQQQQQLQIRKSDLSSLAGLAPTQQRALVAVQKMMRAREGRAREAFVGGVQRGGNKQKFFKPDVPGRSNG